MQDCTFSPPPCSPRSQRAPRDDLSMYTLLVCLLILALQVKNPFLGAQECTPCPAEAFTAEAPRGAPSLVPSHPSAGPVVEATMPRSESIKYRPVVQDGQINMMRELADLQDVAKEHHGQLGAAGRLPTETDLSRRASSSYERYQQANPIPERADSGSARSTPLPSSQSRYAEDQRRPDSTSIPSVPGIGVSTDPVRPGQAPIPPASPPSYRPPSPPNSGGSAGGSPVESSPSFSHPSVPSHQPPSSVPYQAPPSPHLQRSAPSSASSVAVLAPPELGLNSRNDFADLLARAFPGQVGVLLGVGRGDFALHLLQTWTNSGGLYLCDPYIHIWKGYDDPANLSDKDHQFVFEDLRNKLAPYDGRYMVMRDFSFSWPLRSLTLLSSKIADVWRSESSQPPPAFIYVDANHSYEAVKKDLEVWFPLLAKGGLMVGSNFVDDPYRSIGVKSAVEDFCVKNGLELVVTAGGSPPTWFFVKT